MPARNNADASVKGEREDEDEAVTRSLCDRRISWWGRCVAVVVEDVRHPE